MGFVLKEKIFRENAHLNLDVFVVTAYANIIQLIFTFAFLPVSSLPLFGNTPLNELGALFVNGFKCFGGVSPQRADNCFGAPAAPLIYQSVNIIYNISMILLLKYGGALLMFLTNTVTFPLSIIAFAFSWPLLPATPIHLIVLLGLAVEVTGVFIYKRFTQLKSESQAEVEGQEHAPLIQPSDEASYDAINAESSKA